MAEKYNLRTNPKKSLKASESTDATTTTETHHADSLTEQLNRPIIENQPITHTEPIPYTTNPIPEIMESTKTVDTTDKTMSSTEGEFTGTSHYEVLDSDENNSPSLTKTESRAGATSAYQSACNPDDSASRRTSLVTTPNVPDNVTADVPVTGAVIQTPAPHVPSINPNILASPTTNDLLMQLMQAMEQNSKAIEQTSTKLEIKIDQNKYEIQQNLDQTKYEIQRDLEQNKAEIQLNLEQNKAEIKKELEQTRFQTAENHRQVMDRVTKMERLNEERFEKINVVQLEQAAELTRHKIDVRENISRVEENAQRLREHSTRQQEELVKHQNLITELQSSVEILENDTKPPTHAQPLPIHVTCHGSNHSVRNTPAPTFHGRNLNPPEFLRRLKKYYEYNRVAQTPEANQTEQMVDLIESCLERHASKWFCLIRERIRNWTDFETAFNDKYWNRDVQRGTRQKLEGEHYQASRQQTRSEYFIERVLILQSLTPPLNEDEIVVLMADQFDPIIRDAMRVQNLRTIQSFEELLQREDVNDRQGNGKQNPRGPIDQTTRPKQLDFDRNRGNREPRSPNQQRRNYPQNQPTGNWSENNRNNFRPRTENFETRNYHDSRPYNNYNNRPYNDNHQNRPRNQHNNNPRSTQPHSNDKRYPTQEQNRVCTAIVEHHNAQSQNSQNNDTTQQDLNC